MGVCINHCLGRRFFDVTWDSNCWKFEDNHVVQEPDRKNSAAPRPLLDAGKSR